VLVLLVAIVAGIIAHFNGICVPAVISTIIVALKTGSHGLYGLGLLLHEPLNPIPISDYVPIGYFRSLKFKFIYVARYMAHDNFLFEDWLSDLQKELLHDLEARGAPKGAQQMYQIPSFNYDEIEPLTFYNDYVRLGRPAIMRKVPVKAMNWTTDEIARRAGAFRTNLRCMDGSIADYSLADYVASRNQTERACYFDNNANIFEKYPELEAELEMEKFTPHMSNREDKRYYLFSQMFMSVFNTTGALYHCANYNNLFFMIQGRKRWTFVDPSNSFLMYPIFNSMFKDSKSYLTWHVTHANNSDALIDELFPLYRYVPKYESVLEPGDVLINPPWNWHMVENLDADSIGIASRWQIPQFYPYTNALFSFLQFVSPEFNLFLYRRIAQKFYNRGEFVYAPTAHGDLDFVLNFGNKGSIYEKKSLWQRIASPTQWKGYVDYLKSIGFPVNEK